MPQFFLKKDDLNFLENGRQPPKHFVNCEEKLNAFLMRFAKQYYLITKAPSNCTIYIIMLPTFYDIRQFKNFIMFETFHKV